MGASELRTEVISKLSGVYTLAQPPLSYPSQGKNDPEGWIATTGTSRKERSTGSTHHNAGASRPNVVELAVDVSNVVLGWRHVLHASDDVTVWILELFVSKRT